MTFSASQVELLRDTLGFVRETSSGLEGEAMPWQVLAYDIEDYTGVLIPPEVLRKFCRGESRTSERVRFRRPREERLQAIAKYLLHPEIAALTPESLQPRKIATHRELLALARRFRRRLAENGETRDELYSKADGASPRQT